MKRIFTLITFMLPMITLAQVPSLINYSGRLLEADGRPVTGNISMEVNIFNAETDGTNIYNETIGSIPVIEGVYSFDFGRNNLLSALQMPGEHWMEVSIDSTPQSPRQRLVAVPYALRAGELAPKANEALAIGNDAGTNQADYAVAIGANAGEDTQGRGAVAIGVVAGTYTQGINAVAIGPGAGFDTQADDSVAMGPAAGSFTQGVFSVAIGAYAGENTQGDYSVAIGLDAGGLTQGDDALAIGPGAGYSNQGNNAVAIGTYAGEITQGDFAVAIGPSAGVNNQHENSIVLNASATPLNTTTNGLFIKPIRTVKGAVPAGFETLLWNPTTGEIIHVTP